MRVKCTSLLTSLLLMSCSGEGLVTGWGIDYEYGRDIPHEEIVLGEKLQNPYTTENMSKALQSLYPTKADRVDVHTTNYYVRFLPSDEAEYELLEEMCPYLLDHPLDYSIVVDGDWYHDPEVPQGDMTWQYTVVPSDFKFPDIRYEVLDACYLAENDPSTKGDGIDWDAVERESYILTGNSGLLNDAVLTKADKTVPTGRITIVDPHFKGGKPFGVAGVMVSCNSFVKFDKTYTDRDGYYTMDKSYSANLRYRLVFKNQKGFALGFNLVLVPGSVSTLGKSSPDGVNITVTDKSDGKLFRRCVVNNAAYDYFERCAANDLDIDTPPADLRIWILKSLDASSAPMLHHGAILKGDLFREFLGLYAPLIETFLPDITIGAKGRNDYRDLYTVTCHELAHASHYAQVGNAFWDDYILYIISSYLKNGGMTYGTGSGDGAGNCEIGEMWAYYMESKFYKDRYGGNFPTFGTSFWFYPQIFRYLDERGIPAGGIFKTLTEDVVSRESLKKSLLAAYPSKRNSIEQVFSRYGN